FVKHRIRIGPVTTCHQVANCSQPAMAEYGTPQRPPVRYRPRHCWWGDVPPRQTADTTDFPGGRHQATGSGHFLPVVPVPGLQIPAGYRRYRSGALPGMGRQTPERNRAAPFAVARQDWSDQTAPPEQGRRSAGWPPPEPVPAAPSVTDSGAAGHCPPPWHWPRHNGLPRQAPPPENAPAPPRPRRPPAPPVIDSARPIRVSLARSQPLLWTLWTVSVSFRASSPAAHHRKT